MRALVLSGGGAKGAYQVGVLRRWIFDQGRDYDVLCGVSVGAINAGFLAQAEPGKLKTYWQMLEDMWRRANDASVKRTWWGGYLAAMWKPSVYDTAPLNSWIRKGISAEKIVASGRQLRVGAVCLDDGAYKAAGEKDPDIVSWILASSSFPVFFAPVRIAGAAWTDGGVRHVTPIGEAIKLGADDIDVVVCSNPDAEPLWPAEGRTAVPGIALRVVDLMGDQIVRSDIEMARLKNDLADCGRAYRKIKMRLIEPDCELASDSLSFDPKGIAAMMQQGYADALAAENAGS